jgi:flagellin
LTETSNGYAQYGVGTYAYNYGNGTYTTSISVTIDSQAITLAGVASGANLVFSIAGSTTGGTIGGSFGLYSMAVGESISFNFSRAEAYKGVLDQSLMTQLGANTGQVTFASIGDMRSKALGLRYTSVASNEAAQAAITEVDNATTRVSAQRSLLGAIQNRMEYSVNAIETTSENVTAAESRIRDTDMASEMSKYTKENIKAQAAQTMVAQANARAQQVLSLLQ